MSAWNMGGTWLCQPLWERYAFDPDPVVLQRIYPMLKDASLFALDWLRPDARGRLVTPVSLSPENRFRTPDGAAAAVSTASTSDIAMIREVFEQTIAAASILGVDTPLQSELRQALDRLPPYQVGRHGQLQEWLEDWDRPGDEHRHYSHLWGVFPGTQIDPWRTPDLARAAAKSLQMRGDGDLEFTLAWRAALFARLGDDRQAHAAALRLMQRNLNANLTTRCMPRKPEPFEIDGNLGFTASVAAMILQSRLDVTADGPIAEVHLLPAIPEAWSSGQVRGLRACGGIEVDASWTDRRLASATLRSDSAVACRLRCADAVEIRTDAGLVITKPVEPGGVMFDMQPGKRYELRRAQR
jgi:alpha-L-fucosidase 2